MFWCIHNSHHNEWKYLYCTFWLSPQKRQQISNIRNPFMMVPDDVMTMGHFHMGTKMRYLRVHASPWCHLDNIARLPKHHRCNQYCGNDNINQYFTIVVKIIYNKTHFTTPDQQKIFISWWAGKRKNFSIWHPKKHL